jgi:hypothetical protein
VDARRSNSESCETEFIGVLRLGGRIRGGLVYYVRMVSTVLSKLTGLFILFRTYRHCGALFVTGR